MGCYFITFRCYGTWLPGDERGAVKRANNHVGEPRMDAKPALVRSMQTQMNSPRVYLDAISRACVEKTIREVAAHRGWVLYAVNVRTNHVHLVTSANCKPEKVMLDCKVWTTRRLRENNEVLQGTQVWAEHGSTVYLDDTASFENACVYVLERQGEELTRT